MPTRTRKTRPITKALALPAIASILTACGTNQSTDTEQATAPQSPTERADSLAEARIDAEILTLIADTQTLAAALTQHSQTPPLDPIAHERWRRAGLRALIIPTTDALALQQTLAPITEREQLRLLLSGQSTPVALGPRQPATRIQLHSGQVPLDAGNASLTARAWPVPAISETGRITTHTRIDLTPAYTTLQRQRTILDQTTPSDRTWRIEALTYPTQLPPNTSLVIVHESPDADWTAIDYTIPTTNRAARSTNLQTNQPVPDTDTPPGPPLPPNEETTEQASNQPAPQTPQATPTSTPKGPEIPQEPTLGEAILLVERETAAALNTTLGGTKRRLIIITPITPDRFELTPTRP